MHGLRLNDANEITKKPQDQKQHSVLRPSKQEKRNRINSFLSEIGLKGAAWEVLTS